MAVTIKVRQKGSTGSWTTLPTPKVDGFEMTQNRLWSEDSGRVADGSFVGTCIGSKTSLKLTWPRLTGSQAVTLCNTITAWDFVQCSYTDPGGTTRTFNGYFSSPSYHCPRAGVVDGMSVELIEQ